MIPQKKARTKAKEFRSGRGRFTELASNKLRGGYYTPAALAQWMCDWSIRSSNDIVLEPSCGDGTFVYATAERLLKLGATRSLLARNLAAVEIAPKEALAARQRLEALLGSSAKAMINSSDFFSWCMRPRRMRYDVVLGNPPFIRYQAFPEPHRTLAMQLMAEQGLTSNRLTNIWVPFVVAAISLLRPGGRLALVLPAELLQVTYAAQLRSFLTDRFASINIVTCNELFFADAEQEVVLLLADGVLTKPTVGNECRVTMIETDDVEQLLSTPPAVLLARAEPKLVQHDKEKWLKYFLSSGEIALMRELRLADMTTELSSHASVDVGVVTGKNEFFVLSQPDVRTLGLESFVAPLVSRSIHLKGARVNKSDWNEMASAGDRVHLLRVSNAIGEKLPASLASYVNLGEKSGVHKGYKCSIRSPWYAVPSVWVPDAFMFRQIYDFPRLVLNEAGVTSTDTIHRVRCHKGAERTIANTYTWLTAASAEIEGRSYGGGVLELEPTEAERLLVPAKLNGALPLGEVDSLTRGGRLDDVLEENGRIVLRGHMGLSKSECNVLRQIWRRMRDRRISRRRSRELSRNLALL
jgi:adenine-specific DNA-methyltransferase